MSVTEWGTHNKERKGGIMHGDQKPLRAFDKVARRFPNRRKERERVRDYERFCKSIETEPMWVWKRIEEADQLIATLETGIRRVRQRLEEREEPVLSTLHPLTEAGQQHLLRKRLLQTATTMERFLSLVHNHTAFRDEVAAMEPLKVAPQPFPGQADNPRRMRRTLLAYQEEMNRALSDLKQLRRRMIRYLTRLTRDM